MLRYYYIRGLKESLDAVKTLQKTEIQRTIRYRLQGTVILCTWCVSHIGYLEYGNSKGE